MFTPTSNSNPEPARCDAYHEAGHAIVGVALNLQLDYVTAATTAELPPHCRWNYDQMYTLINHRSESSDDNTDLDKQLDDLSKRHAEMCLASRYSEALACNTESDEQTDAYHCDYLDAERIRYCCVGNYFGLRGIRTLEKSTFDLVQKHKAAIAVVADRLLNGERLSHEQVRNLLDNVAE